VRAEVRGGRGVRPDEGENTACGGDGGVTSGQKESASRHCRERQRHGRAGGWYKGEAPRVTGARWGGRRGGSTAGSGGCGKYEEEKRTSSNEAGRRVQARKEWEQGGAALYACG